MTSREFNLINHLFSFNSHPHKEDDSTSSLLSRERMSFNSHPHKEDDRSRSSPIRTPESFNSHPHKEDDVLCVLVHRFKFLSTHILTRRMTVRTDSDSPVQRLSTHILTRRMTMIVCCCPSSREVFQLTSSQGG